MSKLQNLIDNNRSWAERIEKEDPDFFAKLSNQQSPEYLWIGCSDSRVSADAIVDLMPGEIFVHRNVANLVIHTDLNCLSVLQYAVEVLKVKHIIICGHYNCGGIKATLDDSRHGLIDNWLCHIHDICRKHQGFLDNIDNERERFDRLCEINVVEQVVNISQTTILKDAWARQQDIIVHGLIYRVQDGRIHDLDISVGFSDSLEDVASKAIKLIYKKRD
jgi:carbonic anhydrase